MKAPLTILAFASVLAIAGCGQQATETASTETTTETATPSLPNGFFLAEAPPAAVTLSEARANAQNGSDIAFTGYIGGRVEPFTEGRALFLMADSVKAPQCTDTCPAPWDACCTPGETIAANSASVQVVDAEGQTLRLDLNGTNGLAPGSEIAVVGKVRQADDAVLIVDATNIHVPTAAQ